MLFYPGSLISLYEKWTTSDKFIGCLFKNQKEFLDRELAKCKDYKSTDKFIGSLFEDEHGFRRAKAGVGRETILKFLDSEFRKYRKHKDLPLPYLNLRTVKIGSIQSVEQFSFLWQHL